MVSSGCVQEVQADERAHTAAAHQDAAAMPQDSGGARAAAQKSAAPGQYSMQEAPDAPAPTHKPFEQLSEKAQIVAGRISAAIRGIDLEDREKLIQYLSDPGKFAELLQDPPPRWFSDLLGEDTQDCLALARALDPAKTGLIDAKQLDQYLKQKYPNSDIPFQELIISDQFKRFEQYARHCIEGLLKEHNAPPEAREKLNDFFRRAKDGKLSFEELTLTMVFISAEVDKAGGVSQAIEALAGKGYVDQGLVRTLKSMGLMSYASDLFTDYFNNNDLLSAWAVHQLPALGFKDLPADEQHAVREELVASLVKLLKEMQEHKKALASSK